MRILLGAGAGAAIGAAFSAPLTGAFYAFEIVIGAYTPAAIAPVAAAALSAVLTARLLGLEAYIIALPGAKAITTDDYLIYAALGVICAAIAVTIMRIVTFLEERIRGSALIEVLRPAVGGLLLIPLALITPQVLSAGHGALHIDLGAEVGLRFLLLIFVLKVAASSISLGFGFRGGLFFASLFIGSLAGQLFAGALARISGVPPIDPSDAALIGMAAMAVAIVGGPMTMSLLVLETTHDFTLTGVAVTAGLCASTVVRETFGFSFSTWRMHTRGQSIRSARDVGWIRSADGRQDDAARDRDRDFRNHHRRIPPPISTRLDGERGADRQGGQIFRDRRHLARLRGKSRQGFGNRHAGDNEGHRAQPFGRCASRNEDLRYPWCRFPCCRRRHWRGDWNPVGEIRPPEVHGRDGEVATRDLR